MLDSRTFWAFPLETAGRQWPRLSVRCGQALQLRPSAAAEFSSKLRLVPYDGTGWGAPLPSPQI
jgi:hypothetical protein